MTPGGASRFALNVASWNGTTWQAFGSGVAGQVDALTVYNGMVVAGGSAGVLGWNGSSWQPLGVGTDQRVVALAVYGNELYAGGQFAYAGGVLSYNIARWNGSVWQAVGLGLGQLRRTTSESSPSTTAS